MMPESFEYANNGGQHLLHNRGDGTFEDCTDAMGIRSHRWTLAITAADLGHRLSRSVPVQRPRRS